ncbi:LLM class flavin-dependent oxidoreductase [Acinetobacter boissieri]|uniref:FMN-dependent oxidoreductase, nitrilotriacetate monooxygenase family n=1 Tax=Acinetobacter boissieri TaxID=1219383 RepID=A0A1G6JA56_9GAMM|nr:LLM class flavin-dependent oxidoreductase [Acinetobacter boissieri]SDC15265.1 FMN-dependent oxidoreductase, nitrilotriacetate monooxygenase family [Acinetobacter boissieri]
MTKQILLNAFDMNCAGHINHGLWTHPRDQSYRFNELNYWTDLAKTLERGLFDGLFIADIIGVYDVYQNNLDVTLKESVQLPSHDPMTLISGMAAVTTHLGFGVTVNLSYEQPYTLARRFASLDHLTQGRIGWNIVTGYLDSAERLFGRKTLAEHDLRYEQANEFLNVCYQYWEHSWQDDALRHDKTARIFTEPSKVHEVQHHGQFYQSQGVFQVSSSPQRTPVLFQAGASNAGMNFATTHAECIFIGGDTIAQVKQHVENIQQHLTKQGRARDEVKIFVGITVVTAETEQQAQDKFKEYQRYASPEAGLAHYSSSVGINLAQYDEHETIPYKKTNSIQSINKKFKSQSITPHQLKQQHQLGGRYPLFIGSGQQIAQQLIHFLDETGIDGFNLTRTVTPESYHDFIDWVIPELQQQGRYKTRYDAGTLRQKIFKQEPYLPAHHPAKQHALKKSDSYIK